MTESVAATGRPRWSEAVVRCLWITAFVAVLYGSKLYFIGAYGNATPYWDQWGDEAGRLYKPYLEGRLDWRMLAAPHNVHRIVTSRLLALGILSANGIWNPMLQLVVNAAVWVGTLAVLVVLLDRATGRRHLPLLLAFALVAFGLPYGNLNMLWGYQVCFYLVVLWSTLALWAFAVAAPFGAGWWGGIACGLLSFLSLGSGAFTAAAAAAVGAAQYAANTRRSRLQLAATVMLAALFVAGALLTSTPLPTNGPSTAPLGLKLRAFTQTASWPLRIGPFGPLVAFWPALVLTATMLRRPPPAGHPRWFLVAAAAGALGQAAAIAYGRTGGCLAERYRDLFVVAMIVNFACALAVVPEFTDRHRRRAVAAVVAWAIVMLGALAVQTHRHARAELELRRDTAAAQQVNTRAYVLTGDIGCLENKPPEHVPFPNSAKLVALLDDPVIRGILPQVIAPPLTATGFVGEPRDVFVAGGVGPGLPLCDVPTWGSHGSGGPEGTGTVALAFEGPQRGHAVEVPVAVGGSGDGIAIEVEQDGERRPVPVPALRGGWAPVRLEVGRRPFTLHLADRSPTAWVAVAAPVAEGRFDRHVPRILGAWDGFVLSGVVLGIALLVRAGLHGGEL